MKTSLPLIELNNISVQIVQQSILENINLTIMPNSITTIVGPNGAGKSTLLKVLLKLVEPTSGTVVHQPNLKLGYVPQKIHLEAALPITVERFLTLKPRLTLQEIERTLELLSVPHLRKHSLHKLSGGEMQRILLARAMLNQPDLLVLDEPAQGVDITGQAELYQLINQARHRLNCSVLMVSHDLHLVMAHTDEVLCINRHLCCAGTPEAVSNHPSFIDFFGDAVKNSLFEKNMAVYTHHHNHQHNLHGDICTQGQHHHCTETHNKG